MARDRAPVRIGASFGAALVVLATTGAAAAVVHAALLRTEPEAGSVVASAPAEVRLWFSEAVEPASDPVVVLDPRGVRVDEGGRVSPEDVTRLEAPVRDAGPGTYTVRWSVVSEDGHVVSDVHLYSVGRATRTAPAGETEPPSTGALWAARALQGSGAAVAVGALALALLMGAPSRTATRTLTGVGAAGALALLAGAALSAWAQNAALGGAPSPGAVSSGAIWGALWATRAVGAAGLLALFLTARSAGALAGLRRAGAVALSLALLLAIAADGHARATSPVWVGIPVQLAHLGATCAWLGGAASLLALLHSRADEAELVALVPRFSTMALACVVTLIVTGVHQTWSHVARLGLLTTTDYGVSLLFKLGWIGLIAVPASVNRFVVRPRLEAAREGGAATREPLARLGRMIAAELAIGALVVVIGARLATMPPPLELPPAPPASAAVPATARAAGAPAVTRTAAFGGGTLELSLDPVEVGSNEARVTLRGPDEAPRDPGVLRIRATPPPGSSLATTVTTLARDALARRATLRLDVPGPWTLEVSDDAGRSVELPVTVRERPPR